MKPAKILKVRRQLKITDPKIVGIATEMVTRKSCVVTNKNGASYTLGYTRHSKEFVDFLKASGMKVEFRAEEKRRGCATIAGVHVKVVPISHDHDYSKGVLIRIAEKDELSYASANKVKQHLLNRGIDLVKECTLVKEGASCETIFKRRPGHP